MNDHDKISQMVVFHEGEGWSIYGCCGGGCYVITEIRFCPFCGKNLMKEQLQQQIKNENNI
jgi:rRNA maturation endonuclease Nob1